MIVSTPCLKSEIDTLPHDKIPTKEELYSFVGLLKSLDKSKCLKVQMSELSPSSKARLYQIVQDMGLSLKIKNKGNVSFFWINVED